MRTMTTGCRLGLIFLTVVVVPALARGQTVVPLQGITPDRACGPRCLLALIKITGVGRQDCTLKSMYEIIGKEPPTVTSLKDLMYAAEQLGFRAQGYRVSLDALRKQGGYAIVPLALNSKDQGPFLHFVLVKEIGPDYVKFINSTTLEIKAIPTGEFGKVWNGYALVISSRDPKTPLPKPPDDIVLAPGQEMSAGPCDAMWDFGLAENGTLLEHAFLVDPNGIGPDKVKLLAKSCKCVEAFLGQDTEGRACVTLKLRVKEAGWQQADVTLQLPGGVVKRYGVKALGKAILTVRPNKGYLEIPHAGEATYPIEVTYFADANDFIEFSLMRTSLPDVRTGETTHQKEVLKNGAVAHQFTIPLLCRLESEPPGVVVTRKTVEFAFDTSAGQKLVPLEMTIKAGVERVKMLPQRLFLLASASEEPPSRRVKLEFAAEQTPPDEIVARVVGDLPLVVVSSLAGSTCTAEVRVDRDALAKHPAGSRKGSISFVPLEKGKSGNPIELPVTMLIRK